MSNLHNTTAFFWRSFLLLMLVSQPVISADHEKSFSEEYLRSQFSFAPGDTLKYSDCEKKSYPTCTYVWGAESERDVTRLKYGLAPEGNKLQVIYAQANNKKDFQRVLSTYSDPEPVDGIGVEAVWSEKREQLSFITEESLIVHINIDEKGGEDAKEKAVSIAGHVLEQL